MSNYLFCVHQLQSIVNSDLKEGLEGCLITCLGLFSPLWGQSSPHLNWSLHQVLNQHLHRKNIANVKLPFLHVSTIICCQLWHDRKVHHHMFWSFFTAICPISPHLNWSLHQVLNQHLHRENVTNVKLPFLHVSTTIYCQLWCDRRVKRVPHHMFWSFFTAMHHAPRIPHIWTAVSMKLSTQICTKHA